MGLHYLLARRLSAPGLAALRGPISRLGARPSRLPPHQPDPPRRQRRRPLRPDGDRAGPRPARFLAREPSPACPLRRAWRPPCSPCTRCESRRSPGPPASPTCPAPCSRCCRSWPTWSRRGPARPHRGWLAASFVLFVAALLSHAVAVSLPVVLLILDVYPLRRPDRPDGARGRAWRRALWEKVPFVALSAAFVALAIAARGPSLSSVHQSGPAASLARGCHGLWFYLAKTCWPHGSRGRVPGARAPRLADDSVRPGHRGDGRDQPLGLRPEASLPGTAGLLALLRGHPGPELGPGPRQRPDRGRSVRLPLDDGLGGARRRSDGMGVAAMGWAAWDRGGRRGPRSVAGDPGLSDEAAVPDLEGLGDAMDPRCSAHGADASAVAHYNLGLVLQRQGRLAAAASHYAESLRLDPDDAEAQNNLGVVLQRQGKLEAAAAHYSEALRLKPDSVDAHYNLGTVLLSPGPVRGSRGLLHRSPAAQARLRPGLQQPGGRPLSPGDVTRRRRPGSPRPSGSILVARTRTTTSAWPSLAWGTMRKPRPTTPRRCGSIPATSRRGRTWKSRSHPPRRRDGGR